MGQTGTIIQGYSEPGSNGNEGESQNWSLNIYTV